MYSQLIYTMSGRGGTLGLCKALENRVWPLVEGGELKGLKGADGQTGERQQKRRKQEETELKRVTDGAHSWV